MRNRTEQNRTAALLALVLMIGTSSTEAQTWSWRAKADYGGTSVGSGGSLIAAARDNETVTEIYAEPGFHLYNSQSFYRYSPATNAWTQLAHYPWNCARGSVLCDGRGDTVYGFQGAPLTPGDYFRWYNMERNDWGNTSSSAPLSPDTARTLTHAVLNGSQVIVGHLTSQSGRDSLWKYDVAAESWDDRAVLPATAGRGASIIWYGGDTFFMTRGESTHVFWRYRDSAPGFDQGLQEVPSSVFRGGALAYSGHDRLYCLCGLGSGPNSTGTAFYCYDIPNDTWFTKPFAPAAVDSGGAMTSIGSSLYAFRGGGTKTFWLYDEPVLCSNDSFAIGRNNARHLGRKPGTDDLFLAYECHGIIYYTRSSDGGTTWSYPVTVGHGHSPTLAMINGNKAWNAYVKDGQDIMCKIPGTGGTWDSLLVVDCSDGDTADAPSMVNRYEDVPHAASAHLAYRLRVLSVAGYSQNIGYKGFEATSIYGDSELIWTGSDAVSPPCIAVSPGTTFDSVHVVWACRDTVRYRGQCDGSWGSVAPLSLTDSALPASNPFVETGSDSVIVVWTGRNGSPSNAGDIFWRRREITSSVWRPPENLSNSSSVESDYPYLSANHCLAWLEGQSSGQPADVRTKVDDGSPYWLYQSADVVSSFANVDIEYTGPADYAIRGFSTERICKDTLYDIHFFSHIVTVTGDRAGYYDIRVGESVQSPYCLSRGGRVEIGGVWADTGVQELGYSLPYLKPDCRYTVRVGMVYDGPDTLRAVLSLGSTRSCTVAVAGSRRVAIEVPIPRVLQENSRSVTLGVRKLSGGCVAVAGIKVLECDVPSDDEGDGGQSGAVAPVVCARLIAIRPNPVGRSTTIRYELNVPGRVQLSVVDAAGRTRRTLAEGARAAVVHDLTWDGRDDRGGRLTPGVYFVTLRAGARTQSAKVMLTQ